MLVMIIAIWGLNFVVARILSGILPIRVSGILYAFFRYFLGTITMVLVLASQRKSLSQITEEAKSYKGVLFLSALFSALFVMSIHMSAEFISSGTTSILVNLNPIVVLLYGALFLKEKITPMKVTGFLLGLLGGLLFLFNSLTLMPGAAWGILLAVIGLFSWAAYTITLHYLEGADMYIVMTVKHGVSSIMVVPFIYLMIADGTQLVLIVDAWSILGLLFAGVIASGLAYLLYFSAIETLGAPKASSFLFLVPFVSLAGDFLLGEPPSLLSLIAGTIALLGVALVRMSDHERNEPVEPLITEIASE